MAIKLGTSAFNKAFKGATAINKIYAGDYKAFPSGTPFVTEIASPTAVYSMRQVAPNQTRCMQIRRDSDNTTIDIGFINRTLDEQAIIDFCTTSNGFVTLWEDGSGNGRHATQSVMLSQPKIYDVGTGVVKENGKPAISFDGISNSFSTDFSLTQPNSIVSILKPYTVESSSYTFDSGITAEDTNRQIMSPNFTSPHNWRIFAARNLTSSVIPTLQTVVICGLFNGGGSNIRLNGNQIISGDVGTNNMEGMQIGKSKITNNAWHGAIQEIIFYNVDTSDNISQIENNINGFYQIY